MWEEKDYIIPSRCVSWDFFVIHMALVDLKIKFFDALCDANDCELTTNVFPDSLASRQLRTALCVVLVVILEQRQNGFPAQSPSICDQRE